MTKDTRIRTRTQIIENYRDFLFSKGFIKKTDPHYLTKEGMADVYEILLEKVHETELVNGVRCNTLDSFHHFCTFIIHHDVATGKTIWNKFLSSLFLDIERHRFSAIMASRSGGKSFGLSLYCLHKMFQFPFLEIIYSSNIPKQSSKITRVLRRIVNNNEILVSKRSKDEKDSEKDFGYNNGLVETTALGTPPQSSHVNLIIFDDILRPDNKYSDEQIVDYVYQSMRPCGRRKKARQILLGTSFHSKDIFHYSMKDETGELITDGRLSKKGWFCKVYKAIKSFKTELINPVFDDVFTWKELMAERDAMGESRFMREYQLLCLVGSARIFPERILNFATSHDYEYYDVDDDGFDKRILADKMFVISGDVASSGSASADYTVFIVLEIQEIDESKFERGKGDAAEEESDRLELAGGNYRKIVRYVYRSKGVDISEQIDILERLADIFNNAYVLVEQNNIGITHIQELQKRNVNIDSFVTSRARKESGIRFLYSELHNKYKILEKQHLIFPALNENVEIVKKELMNFGVKKGRNGVERMEALAGHDDCVMSLMIANMATQTMSFGDVLPIVQN